MNDYTPPTGQDRERLLSSTQNKATIPQISTLHQLATEFELSKFSLLPLSFQVLCFYSNSRKAEETEDICQAQQGQRRMGWDHRATLNKQSPAATQRSAGCEEALLHYTLYHSEKKPHAREE